MNNTVTPCLKLPCLKLPRLKHLCLKQPGSKQLGPRMYCQTIRQLAKRLVFAFVFVLAFVISGCGSNEGSTNIDVQGDTLSLTAPDRIRQVRALDIESLEAIATINGQETEFVRSGEQFRVSVPIPSNSNVSISILFRERLDNGGVLNLANFSTTLDIGSTNETLQVFDNEFNDAPFDEDGDQISNLAEREEDTDPFVFDARPDNRSFTINFTLPGVINDPQITQVITTIAGTPRAVRREGNDFEITGLATTRASVTVEVILLQRLDSGIPLVLADATREVPSGIQDVFIELSDADFNFDRDQDGDNRTNLEELQNGTDPFRAD